MIRTSTSTRLARFTTAALLVGALLGIGAAPAAAGTQCLTFAGLQHCAIGSATLALPQQDTLQVNNPSQAIGSGVSITMPDVTSWSGSLSAQYASGTTPTLRSSALSDGVVTSRSEVKKIGNRFTFAASFTGSAQNRRYTVSLYRAGALVATIAHVPSANLGGTAALIPSGKPGGTTNAITILVQMAAEFVVAPRGECEWLYSFATPQNVELPDGRILLGDELRQLEEVDPAGGYAYTTFDGLNFQGNFLRNELKDESVAF